MTGFAPASTALLLTDVGRRAVFALAFALPKSCGARVCIRLYHSKMPWREIGVVTRVRHADVERRWKVVGRTIGVVNNV